MQASGTDRSDLERGDALYFFPDVPFTAADLRHLLTHGTDERRAWAISHLLRFADWDDIWTWVTREQVCELFPQLDLPAGLRAAWAKMLRIENAPVG